jgi:hydrogenase maturation protease
VVIGMEPADYQTMAVELSSVAQAAMPAMVQAVLQEVAAAGGTFSPQAQ